MQRILGFLSFNDFFVLASLCKRGVDLAHKGFLARGIVYWRADGRASGASHRVLRRGLGCIRQTEADYDSALTGAGKIKIVAVGDRGTGKTSFIKAFIVGDEFEAVNNLPVEPPFVVRCCCITNNKELDLGLLTVTLCDLPLDENLQEVLCFNACDVALFFFCDAQTFAGAELWLKRVQQYAQYIIIVEAKSEGEGVGDELRARAQDLASQIGGYFVRTSAKRNFNIVHCVRMAIFAKFLWSKQQKQSNLRASKRCLVQ